MPIKFNGKKVIKIIQNGKEIMSSNSGTSKKDFIPQLLVTSPEQPFNQQTTTLEDLSGIEHSYIFVFNYLEGYSVAVFNVTSPGEMTFENITIDSFDVKRLKTTINFDLENDYYPKIEFKKFLALNDPNNSDRTNAMVKVWIYEI